MPAPLAIRRIDSRRDDVAAALAELRRQLSPRGDVVSEAGRRRTIEVFGEPLAPAAVVERICRDVEARGLAAVLEYTARLDGAQLTVESIRVAPAELAAAHAAADPAFLAAVRRIRANILEFQQAVLARDVRIDRPDGTYLCHRYRPLGRVGICVPGGAAAYPSTVLMTAVPAQAAGVAELAIVAPPTKFGANNPDILATCHELGIGEVYRLGGAQGVAALAYGLPGLPAVDKIVGPGNLFVALAKQFVFGRVDIDSIAGPSEVVVVADETARADCTAADLVAQAEHAPGASVLVSWSESLLDGVADELARQTAHLARGDLARESLEQFGALIQVADVAQACQVADSLAPEHLHVNCRDAAAVAQRIPHAGAAFIGPHSPVAVGDYVAGPSHVLPTGGTARFASGLSANSFRRSHSVIAYSAAGLAAAAPDLQLFAAKEGLTAHWESVRVRMQKSK